MTGMYWLSEIQLPWLAHLLPDDTRGVVRGDDRWVVSKIIHVLRSGSPRKNAPPVYGPHKGLYNRFVRSGCGSPSCGPRAATGEPCAAPLIGSPAVEAHRCAAGGKGGTGRSVVRAADAPPKFTRSPILSAGLPRSS